MFRRILRAVPLAGIAVALSAASAGTSLAATRAVTLPAQALFVKPGADTAVSFSTLPGARCTVANPRGRPFVFYSDLDGSANLHVQAPAGRGARSITVRAECTAAGVTAASWLSLTADAHAAPQSVKIRRVGPLQTLGPRGFNPAAASDATLARYGYPPRPKTLQQNPLAAAAWLEAVTTPAVRITRSVPRPDQFMGPAERLRGAGQRLAAGPTTSNNWSGYAAFGAGGSPFSVVLGEWTVPQVYSGLHEGSFSSLWAGLDGWTDNDVVQAGTEQDSFPDCNWLVPYCWQFASYNAWYEFYPDSEQETFSVDPGDRIFTESWVTFNAAGVPVGNFIVEDMTSHVAAQNSETMPQNDPSYPGFDGSSAEWIMERPEVTDWFGLHSYLPPLPDYLTASFTLAIAEQRNGTVLNYSNAPGSSQITMTNNGHSLSSVAPVDFESMLFTWYAYD